MSEESVAFNVIISGRVKGVFFRASMKSVAEANNTVGWVRNLDDGRVEALIQGRRADVSRVLEWCKVGPKNSVVNNVEIAESIVEPRIGNFSIKL